MCLTTEELCCDSGRAGLLQSKLGPPGASPSLKEELQKEQVCVTHSTTRDSSIKDGVICDDDLNLAPLKEIN